MNDESDDEISKETADQTRFQLPNGRWQCNHTCTGGFTKKGKSCSHKCCREGVQYPRPPKATAKKSETGGDTDSAGQSTTNLQVMLPHDSERRRAHAPVQNRSSKRWKGELRPQTPPRQPANREDTECIDLSMLDDDADFGLSTTEEAREAQGPRIVVDGRGVFVNDNATARLAEGEEGDSFDESLFDDMDLRDISELLADKDDLHHATAESRTSAGRKEAQNQPREVKQGTAEPIDVDALSPAMHKATTSTRTREPTTPAGSADGVGRWNTDTLIGGGDVMEWQPPSTLDTRPAIMDMTENGDETRRHRLEVQTRLPATSNSQEPAWLGDVDPQVIDMLRGYVSWSEGGV